MKTLPEVTIVGRQNVGKSTLFNLITNSRSAITHDYPGVTRDVIKVQVERAELSKPFILCDSPGLDIENVNDLTSSVIEVSFQQLLDSDIIIFMIDKNAITDYDHKLIELFLRDNRFTDKKFIYCLNKADNPDEDLDYEYFYKSGLTEILPISALGRRNIKLLYEKLDFYLKSVHRVGSVSIDFKIAIIGKPNSGKSSLLNAIIGFNRAVVSEIAGTTRDPINSIFKFNEKSIELIDTAGIRKQSKNSEDKLEFLSFNRTIKTIESCDVVIHLIDSVKGIGEYDKKIFSLVQEKGKPCILAMNKWDLIEDKSANTLEEYKQNLVDRFFMLKDIPMISISTIKKQRIHKLLEECMRLNEKTKTKISTSKLNADLRKWLSQTKLVSLSKRPPKLLYCTQISTSPFKIIFFVNDVDLFKPSLLSYLKKKLITEYSLIGVHVFIELRSDRK